MKKYYCTVLFDASSNVTVEATTPEEAAEKAECATDGNQRLCHQCADTLDTGESLGVLVYDENGAEEWLDTRYRPQRTLVELTEEEIVKLVLKFRDAPINLVFAVQAKLKEKNI
jgi:hypothetical protein